MYKLNREGLIVDPVDDRPVATFVDSFSTSLGVGQQADTVIVRLYHLDWPAPAGLVPPQHARQYALPATRAAELGRQLLELATQAEKEVRNPRQH